MKLLTNVKQTIRSARLLTRKNCISYTAENREASNLIAQTIRSKKPSSIVRFGGIELDAFFQIHFENKSFPTKLIRYHQYVLSYMNNEQKVLKRFGNNAGFFPSKREFVKKYHDLILKILPDIDILGSWEFLEAKENYLYKSYFPNAKIIPAVDLEPYYNDPPWSRALEDANVLVIHPFADSIREQYLNRTCIFPGKDILPRFNLTTIKAVQSIAQANVPFTSWFEALEHMKKQIESIQFDVAIIGCGAYSIPLANHVKKVGKVSIQLGGSTQILFGIKGKRWENHPIISKFFNKHWVYPSPEETPQNAKSVEEGCYW